ncbi:MAG: hypothetical protein Q7U35_05775 [Methanobacteriaceae archaeon]|nr:hypothetical protein [Methanobacteriaceae archaeon]MDP2835824.1 hypothetical protein [Methanobacteriaceae archaeon]MDP3034627.1 hypothetical protein [Methanobacteriaceae archaeon]MDP3623282.1 hypothetical protein [Methanobacteriaceae archaeon]
MKSSYHFVKFDYKARLDSIYVNILGSQESQESFQVSENVIIDINSEKIPVQFKIVDASVLFQEKKSLLKNLSNVKIDLKIDSEFVHFKGQIDFAIDNDILSKEIDVTAPNDIKISEMQGTYAAGRSF